jgi:hypothetical protein
MDRQEKRKNEGAPDNASDGTPDNSDMEDKVSSKKILFQRLNLQLGKDSCCNCCYRGPRTTKRKQNAATGKNGKD